MKWAAVMVASVVLGAVGAFAVYTFGWRDDPVPARDMELDRARAELAAGSATDRICFATPCKPTDLKHREGPVWTFRARNTCYLIDIDRFALSANGGPNEGLGECLAEGG